MTNEEAVRKLEYSKKAYQMLIDEKVDSGILVGKDVKGEWKADTPLDEAYKSMIEALEMGIKAIKALEQEPKTGHWTRELIRNEKGGCIGAKMICSECGNDNKHDEYMTYCPNCGAKMQEVEE